MSAKAILEEAEAEWKALDEWVEAKGLKDTEPGDFEEEDWGEFQERLAKVKALREKYATAADREASIATEKGFLEETLSRKAEHPVKFQPIMQDRRQETGPRSLGEKFVNSDGYKQLIESGALNTDHGKFNTGQVSWEAKERKAASDILTTATSGTLDGIPISDFLTQLVDLPPRELVIRELFAQGTTQSETVSYVRMTARDSAAATVAQATATNDGLKPQSSIAFDRQNRPVETIATWMAVTRQSLQDWGMLQGIIDNQGRIMLQLEEENQLLSGDGNAPNLQGIIGETGVQTLDLQTGGPEDIRNLDGLRTAKRLVKTGTAKARADTVVMHPADSEEYDLLKDADENYRAGNPFGGVGEMQSIWNMRRVESEAITEGTVLVGAFRFGATVMERQPITVYTTDSHDDFFVRNLSVVLFEERLGFPIFYPSAFVNVSLNEWGAGSGSGA